MRLTISKVGSEVFRIRAFSGDRRNPKYAFSDDVDLADLKTVSDDLIKQVDPTPSPPQPA